MANPTIVVGLIARVENFIKGMKKSQDALNGFNKGFQRVKSLMSAGVGAYMFKGLADGITSFSKATREGEDSIVAFTKTLPMLGQIEESFHNMFVEVSGLNKELEDASKLEARAKIFGEIQGRLEGAMSSASGKTKYDEAERKRQEGLSKLEQIRRQYVADYEKQMAGAVITSTKLGKVGWLTAEVTKTTENDVELQKKLTTEHERRLGLIQTYRDVLQKTYDIDIKMLDQQKMLNVQGVRKKEIESDVNNVLDFIKTKRDKMNDDLLKIDALKRRGLLSEEQAGLASAKIRKEYMKEHAYSVEVGRNMSISGMSIGDKDNEAKTTNELLREQNRILNETKNLLVMN